MVAKHAREAPPERRIGLLRSAREERFSDTMLTFYRWTAAEDEQDR